ncbi:uncharacterized protein LOC101448554 isoform X2 [Ceratitis capitata]|uniref:uncharacterized protein LOC101448554 isoform X2 n=1 Tax=Ceratitis capitata TaxID=7213 RepID=UPI0006188C6B|nr:uncharacterized protein LOC101448554 isoform X2 [Ceratitis capitata]
MNMAPSVCVTSFRMLMRRTELSSHLYRGLRLTPTGPYLLNSWSTRRYCKQSDDTSKAEQPQRTGKTKTVNENSVPTAKESNLLSKSMQTHNLKKPHQTLTADETLSKVGDELAQLKLSQLRAQLRAHGLSPVGKKDVLVQRLQSYLQLKEENLPNAISTVAPDKPVNESETSDSEMSTQPKASASHDDTLHYRETQLNEAEAQHKEYETGTGNSNDKHTDAVSLAKRDLPSNQATAKHTSENIVPYEDTPNCNNTEQHTERTANTAGWVSTSDGCGETRTQRDGNGADVKHDDSSASSNHSDLKLLNEEAGEQVEGDVYVEYIQGLPHLTVPLPSRLEKCRFALRPVSQKVGDLIEMLKIEDHGIDRAVVLNKCGVRIASTCAIDSLMDEPFWLQINDNKYEVNPPKRKKMDSEDLQRLSDVRTLVAQLYEALHVGEYHLHKEQELVKKIENLKFEISPLEMEKQELARLAERKTVIATWVGLSLMAVQFGVLARLTWWEYSWDIMEPVTYFVTYGTTMAIYAYYCLTKSEYAFETVRDRLYLITMHKKAKRKNFDIEKYNLLKRELAEAEYDLRRLRDPINLQLPPHIDRSQRITPIQPPNGSGGASVETRNITAVTSEKKPVSFRLPFLDPKN